MVIQHNMLSSNTSRQLKITSDRKAKRSEKLGSGYRINRAADDVAGLAISEKLRHQIRGLTQASYNTQDGISLVQTADGALDEVNDMLQRMRELSVQAANDTNQEQDRVAIQREIDSLLSEVDRVSASAQFNEINLLDGTLEVRPDTSNTTPLEQFIYENDPTIDMSAVEYNQYATQSAAGIRYVSDLCKELLKNFLNNREHLEIIMKKQVLDVEDIKDYGN